jgi:hypothetical protein
MAEWITYFLSTSSIVWPNLGNEYQFSFYGMEILTLNERRDIVCMKLNRF